MICNAPTMGFKRPTPPLGMPTYIYTSKYVHTHVDLLLLELDEARLDSDFVKILEELHVVCLKVAVTAARASLQLLKEVWEPQLWQLERRSPAPLVPLLVHRAALLRRLPLGLELAQERELGLELT